MAHTRAARYLRKRLRNLLRRLTPCCIRSHEPAESTLPAHQNRRLDEEPVKEELITAFLPETWSDEDTDTAAVVWEPAGQEQLLASFVSNYIKEIIFNARVKFYIEDMIIKGSLAIIGSILPAHAVEIT